MDIAEFLLARIAEAERCSQVATWVAYDAATEGEIIGMSGARVLAECEAKRRIVEHSAAMAEQEEAGYHDRAPLFALSILRLLALSYVDHPDYDPAWSVTVSA